MPPLAGAGNTTFHAVEFFVSCIEDLFRRSWHGNDPVEIFTSQDRKVPALWNMVTTRGATVGALGIWNTWPAEEVSGYIVSDRYAHTLWEDTTERREIAEVTGTALGTAKSRMRYALIRIRDHLNRHEESGS